MGASVSAYATRAGIEIVSGSLTVGPAYVGEVIGDSSSLHGFASVSCASLYSVSDFSAMVSGNIAIGDNTTLQHVNWSISDTGTATFGAAYVGVLNLTSGLNFASGPSSTNVTGKIRNQPADDAIEIDFDSLTITASDFTGSLNTNIIRDYLSNGVLICQTTTDKLGFLGVTPIPRRASANQAALNDNSGGTASTTISAISDTNTKNAIASIVRLLNQLRNDLLAYGLIKGTA
jgi:hypothetical protein